MTSTDACPQNLGDLDRLLLAAEHLDRWTLQKLRIRLDAMERDGSPELDHLTDEAARLTGPERHRLCMRIRDLHPMASDFDEDMDVAESLANENALA